MYSISKSMNTNILIFLLIMLSGVVNAQSSMLTFSGEVRNSTDGQSIPDVNVVFKDSTAIFTTVTDANGKFKLPITTLSKKAKLEISCIGFETKNFNASTQKVFYLNEKTEVLNAVTISKAKERTSPFFLRHLFDYSINFIPKEKVAMFIPFKESNKNRRIKFLKYQLADVYGVKNLKFLPLE